MKAQQLLTTVDDFMFLLAVESIHTSTTAVNPD